MLLFISDIYPFNAAFTPPTVLQSVEFQKRGLPHAHILIWLQKDGREGTTSVVDSFISAEIPDPTIDPLGYSLVEQFMIHGPCGEHNRKCVCMKKMHAPSITLQNLTTKPLLMKMDSQSIDIVMMDIM